MLTRLLQNPGVAAAAALLDGQQPLHKPALGGAGYYPQQQHCPAGGQQPLQPSHLNGGPADGGGRQGVQVSLHGAFEAAAAGQEWCYEQNNLMLRQLHMEWLQRRGGLG